MIWQTHTAVLRETASYPHRPTYVYVEHHSSWTLARKRAAMLIAEARDVDGLTLRRTRRDRWCAVGPDGVTHIIEVLP